MSFEDDLGRQLIAKASTMRVTPDPEDLAHRIRSGGRRSARLQRLALGAAMIVLAGSLGGLVGSLVSSPAASPRAVQSGYQPPGSGGPSPNRPSGHRPLAASHGDSHPKASRDRGDGPAGSPKEARFVVAQQFANGVRVSASEQALASVAISGGTSARAQVAACASAEVVDTTVGHGSIIGGGTGVVGLPNLGPDGLETVSSGLLPLPAGGGQVWWATFAVGSRVARVAAEDPSGPVVAVKAVHQLAVVAGVSTATSAQVGDVSAVAEAADGQSAASVGFLLGSGPKAVDISKRISASDGCHFEQLPSRPASAAVGGPADPPLAAASILAAFEQAYSPDELLGFAANLAAVSDGTRLSAAATHPPATFAGSSSARIAPGSVAVTVRQVSFVSAARAQVVYRIGSGVLTAGTAELAAGGVWQVSLPTFCGDIRAGAAPFNSPAAVLAACGAIGNR